MAPVERTPKGCSSGRLLGGRCLNEVKAEGGLGFVAEPPGEATAVAVSLGSRPPRAAPPSLPRFARSATPHTIIPSSLYTKDTGRFSGFVTKPLPKQAVLGGKSQDVRQ